MKTIRTSSLVLALLAVCALPALASITVYSPSNGATVPTQFTLSAAASDCSGQTVSAMGFSLDSSSNTTIVKTSTLDAQVSSATGSHTLHVKAWGNAGAVCVTDVGLNVVNSTNTTTTTTTTSSTTTSAVNGITVSSPTNGATVQTTFSLSASATLCSSQAVTAMGYSLDGSSNTAIVKSTSVQALVTASTGSHTLHVKSWGNSGASCVNNVSINVTSSGTTSTSTSSTSSSTSGVSVSSPTNGSSVPSPIPVAASASTCSGQKVTAIGYGLDNNSKTVYTGTSLSTQVPASTGSHTVHFTAWGSGGAACSAAVTVNVTSTSSPTNSIVPSNATNVSSIQTLTNWKAVNDPAAGGSTSGTTSLVGSPSLSGNARKFYTTFSNSGGELYHASFGDDPYATNFFYDAWVYFSGSAGNVANLEMDMNQVMSNGQTVIYGFQCDGYSGTWDYTENAGSPTSPNDHWVHSSAPCNVRSWSVNTWHHVQVYYSRDSSGNVTYHSVWLDGQQSQINAKVPSAFALGWGQVLLTNFQMDGLGSGSNTIYLDKLTISRW